MNFTSQICTTKEQSERLLALGLKKETADMTYLNDKICAAAYNEMECPYDNLVHPAWSLHRLMEILPKEVDIDGFRFPLRSDAIHRLSEVSSIYDTIIGIIERTVEMGHLNQGYLEE